MAVLEHDSVFPCARDANTSFYVKTLKNPDQEVRGHIVILHDLFDYHGRYLRLARELCNLGFSIHLLDIPGFGRSAGARGVIDHHDHPVDDVEGYLCQLPAPAIIIGSGYGALNAIRLHHRGGLPVNRRILGLVLVAPMLRLVRGIPEVGNFVYERLRHPFDLIPLPWRLEASERANSEEAVLTAVEDPLVRDLLLLRTYREVEKLTKLEQNASYLIDVPTLTMLPGSDTISSLSFVKLFNKAIDTELSRLIEYSRSKRDLVNDCERDQVMKDLTLWLQEHF